jgi:molecular chaperone DnaK (HSP70)
MPSVVHLDGDTVWVGQEAIAREMNHPDGTYRNVKRVIGTGDNAARAVANVVPNLVIRKQLEKVTNGETSPTKRTLGKKGYKKKKKNRDL